MPIGVVGRAGDGGPALLARIPDEEGGETGRMGQLSSGDRRGLRPGRA